MDMTAPPPIVTTERLRLRKPTLSDAAAIFDVYASDPGIPRFMSWRPHTRLSETESYLQSCLDEWSSGKGYPYVIDAPTASDRLIGMIHLHAFPLATMFGYVIGRDHWNKGYTTEALRCLVDWSLSQPAIFRASAFCDVENAASARVMEKAGMSFEGTLRRYFIHPNISDEPRDCLMYAKVT